MRDTVKIVGLTGSLNEQSTSTAALRLALTAAKRAGAEVELVDIRELDLPLYRPEAETPAAANRLAAAVESADGMIWASPLYHGTISGAFKNALDWLQLLGEADPPYLTDKPVGLVSTAGGVQGLQAINTMEYVVRALRGWAVPLTVPISKSWQVFEDDGTTEDEDVIERLQMLGHEVVKGARRLSRSPRPKPTPRAITSE